MIEDCAGNLWVVRRMTSGVIQLMGWDADEDPLISDWIEAETGDIVDYCHWADGLDKRT